MLHRDDDQTCGDDMALRMNASDGSVKVEGGEEEPGRYHEANLTYHGKL